MFSESYVRLILAVAPFVVCLALALEPEFRRKAWIWLGGACLFALGVMSEGAAPWVCFPWLILAILNAGQSLLAFSRKSERGLPGLAVLASDLYLPVGAVWALFDQFHFQPLGFSGIIVLLTGVHFHYAGFALPRLTGLWLARQKGGFVFQLSTWGVIAGVPLVAVGITTSQMQMSPAIELVAVTVLAFSAFTVSLGQASWALRSPPSLPAASRVLFGAGGVCLAGGMVLATIYGWRSVFPVAWATIPAMYAIHGTLNSLGFCLPGFLAWHLLARGSRQPF